jgi:hypothetical protein
MSELQHPDLAARLRNAFAQPAIEVPAEVEEAVLAVIAERAGQIRERRARRWWPAVELFPRYAWATAAVAVVALAILMWSLNVRPKQQVSAQPYDIDGDGQVDIVDAYQMARRIASGKRPPSNWDFNRDGVVDERDVSLIAQQSVAVSNEET